MKGAECAAGETLGVQRDARRPSDDGGPSTSSAHFSAECVSPLSKDIRRKFDRGNKYDITRVGTRYA